MAIIRNLVNVGSIEIGDETHRLISVTETIEFRPGKGRALIVEYWDEGEKKAKTIRISMWQEPS